MPTILLSLFLTSQIYAAAIPVLALNEKGETIEGQMDEKEYVDSLRLMKEALDEKVIQLTVSDSPKWQLSKFTLGLGLTGEIGVGPYKYSSTLKQRFVYSR